jgi:hypothetical protein
MQNLMNLGCLINLINYNGAVPAENSAGGCAFQREYFIDPI